jgi:hypothetical protein
MTASALGFLLALSLAAPPAAADTGCAACEDSGDCEPCPEDSGMGGGPADGNCTDGSGGVNTSLIVLVGLGFSGLASWRRRRDA